MLINFKKYNSFDYREVRACKKVVESGNLSGFIGNRKSGLKSGYYVSKFEREIEKFFKVKYAITVNSWTSGLICAVGAIGIEPGDEVIVPTWTMSACATAILHWNAIPVFADIETETFNICPKSILKNISKKTKAIIVVDIFGHPAQYDEIKKIALKHKLKLIGDSAQSIGVKYKGKYTGTQCDISGFSLNYHKQIHTGEGGIILTNNKIYAKKLKLLRNHAEVVLAEKSRKKDLINMLGYNFRLGEIEAAIGICQLKKLKNIIKKKMILGRSLIKKLSKLPYINLPVIKKNCTHSFYAFPIVLELKKINVTRNKILKLLYKSGIKGLAEGYQNLHLLPIYQKKIAYGSKNFPWSLNKDNKINYRKGICPNAENLHFNTLISYGGLSFFDLKRTDISIIAKIFFNVWRKLKIT
jgi:dTDP-4-amino-4,6-dideoxygalactose transaminase